MKIHKRKIIISAVSVIAGLLIFQAGIAVGYHKAFFSYRGGDRLYGMMGGEGISPSHGAAGKVVSVGLPSFVVAGQDNLEKTVIIGDKTIIRRFRSTVAPSDIKVDDLALVLGDPDQSGNIQARFIRLMPSPASN